MIAADLDKTLLHNDGTISAYTVEVLNKCAAKGVKIVFATARPKRAAESLITDINCDAVIHNNGTSIMYFDGIVRNDKIYLIRYDTVRHIIKYCSARFPESRISAEINDKLYINFEAKENECYQDAVHIDINAVPQINADKISIEIKDREQVTRLKKLFQENLKYELIDEALLTITHSNASKLSCLKILADKYCISLADTLAIGDNSYDLEMIKRCGVGVAMYNADSSVAQAADYVADDNNTDGAAKFIEKMIL